MKPNLPRSLLAATTLAIALPVAAQEQPVRIKTDGMPSHLRERLHAKAQEGPAALIQYVNRTRMMGYQVRVEDLVVPRTEATAVATADATANATADATRRTEHTGARAEAVAAR